MTPAAEKRRRAVNTTNVSVMFILIGWHAKLKQITWNRALILGERTNGQG